MNAIEQGCAVEDFSFRYHAMGGNLHQGFVDCTNNAEQMNRILIALGAKLRFFRFSLEHTIYNLSDMVDIVCSIYNTAKGETPNLEILYLDLFSEDIWLCLPVDGFSDDSDMFPPLEFIDPDNSTPAEIQIRRCQIAARSTVRHLPKLRHLGRVAASGPVSFTSSSAHSLLKMNKLT